MSCYCVNSFDSALKRSCNFSRAKIERINTVARHVLLQVNTHTLGFWHNEIDDFRLNLEYGSEITTDWFKKSHEGKYMNILINYLEAQGCYA